MFRTMCFRPEGGNVGGEGASGAVAGTPALTGEGGQIVVMPNTGATPAAPFDNRSAVERASDAARASIATNGTALREPGAAQPRAADGTFEQKPGAQVEERTPEQIAADETAEAERVAAEAAANEGKTPEEIAAEADAVAAERRIELTISDEVVPVEFDDPAVAAQFREAMQIADRADEITARAESQIEEVMAVRNAVEIDPVGFVLGEVGNNPAAIEHLVLSLLTRDTPETATLRATVAALAADPNKLLLTAAQQVAARTTFRDEATHRVAEQATIRQNLKDVQTVVRAILPSGTPELQQVAYHDMMMDLKSYAERNNLLTLPVEDIPMLLSRRLTALGVDPVQAATLANEAINRPPSRASARGVAPNRVKSAVTGAPRGKPAVVAPAAVPKTGKAFVASAASRKAAVVPGSGAGSPGTPATLAPPRNADGSKMTTEQTVAWHRARLQKGVKSY